MNLQDEKYRINKYLSSEKSWPIIVDVQTRADLADLKDYFSVGNNKILSAESFCAKDGTFKLEEFYNAISNNHGNTFITELTVFLKLQGEAFIHTVFKYLVSKSISGHIVVVTYQCKNYLKFSDTRITESGRVIISNSEPDAAVDVCLISPDLARAFPGCFEGFEKVAGAIEKAKSDVVYIATDVDRKNFPESIFNMTQMNNGYDILCNRDSRTKTVPMSFGSAAQWNSALRSMGSKGNWNGIIDAYFGSVHNLSSSLSNYLSFDDERKWLYYIVVSIFGVKDSEYLQLAINAAADYKDLIRSLYRTILTIDYKSTDFYKLFSQRKQLIASMSDTTTEAVEYCKVISVKGKEAIHYLTDGSQPEKERIITWLDVYGSEYDTADLIKILQPVYPDLANYLGIFRYKNPLLDLYFGQYKYQKIVNHILPTFEALVDEQSQKFGFVEALPPRTSLTDKIDVKNAHAYFFDALGVEYLAFIQAKCNEYGLSTSIVCARGELPTLTCFNKDFVEVFKGKGCPVSDIKDLDDIKHHGEDSFDYEKVKVPVYLIRELEIIDELLRKIRANILAGHYEKAIVISDHGSSRLAVLHDTENVWEMATNGVHSGRCCPKNEINDKPDFAIEAENFWVLANYDRFRGGRRANCEVHGGATLEEVAVPIIEITRKQSNVEAFIVDASRVVVLGAKEHAVIRLYVGLKSNNIAIRINDQYYDADTTADDYIYSVDLPEYSHKGTYHFDILNGSDVIASSQAFEIRKKGMSENNLFS